MRATTFDEYLKGNNLKPGTFAAQENRKELALAFGMRRRLPAGVMLDLDWIALDIRNELSQAFTLAHAATVVLVFGDKWLRGVGVADTQVEPVFFFVAEYGDEWVRNRFGGFREQQQVGVVTFDGIAFGDHPDAPIPDRMTLVNLTAVLRRVRARAAKIGLDFSAPFFPPPDHPLHVETIETAKRQREAALQLYREHGKAPEAHIQ